MKCILYDMGPLTLVRWPLRGLSHPLKQNPSWRGSPHPKIGEKKLNQLLGKFQCFNPIHGGGWVVVCVILTTLFRYCLALLNGYTYSFETS